MEVEKRAGALVRCGRHPCVNELTGVVHDPLDHALLLQMSDGHASQTTVDFESLNEDALTDEAEGGDFLHDAVVCWLVEHDGVLSLVLDFTLGPLLLLGGFST